MHDSDSPPVRVLLVGHDPQVVPALCSSLRESGIAVVATPDERRARQLHERWLPDLTAGVVLEPARDGIGIRRPAWATGHDDPPEVRGPSGPAISIDEAAAAVRSTLRSTSPAYRSSDDGSGLLRVADLVVDEQSGLAAHRGRVLLLNRVEFGLLRHLARNAGHPVERARIVEHVWPLSFGGSTSVVDHYTCRLRAITRGGTATIRSVRGHGYLLGSDEAPAVLGRTS